jgi:hypothetical protein
VLKLAAVFMRGAALAFYMTTADVVPGGYYELTRKAHAASDSRAEYGERRRLYTTSLELAGFARDPLSAQSS